MVPKFVKDDQFNCDHHDPDRTSLVPKGHLMFGCEDCDWDACPACFRRDNPFQYRAYINMLVRFKHPGLKKQRDAAYKYIPLPAKRPSITTMASPPPNMPPPQPPGQRPMSSDPGSPVGPPPPMVVATPGSPPIGTTILPPPPMDDDDPYSERFDDVEPWNEVPSTPGAIFPPPAEHQDDGPADASVVVGVPSVEDDDNPDVGSPGAIPPPAAPWSTPGGVLPPPPPNDPGSPAAGTPWSPPSGLIPAEPNIDPGSPAPGAPWSPPPGAAVPIPPPPARPSPSPQPPPPSGVLVVAGGFAQRQDSDAARERVPPNRASASTVQERRSLAEAYVAKRTWRHVGVAKRSTLAVLPQPVSAASPSEEWADGDLDSEIEDLIAGHERETSAAMKIQASFRGFQGRRQAQSKEKELLALAIAKKEAEDYRRLYEETQQQLALLTAAGAAVQTVSTSGVDTNSDDDDTDDDDSFDDDPRGSARGTYLKLLDAVSMYDDSLPESAEANQVLVLFSRSLTQETIDSPPPKIQPALAAAVEQQKVGATMILMYSGASAIVRDRDGRTLLHIALSSGHSMNVELASMLFSQGLSLDDLSSEGRTVFQHLDRTSLLADVESTLQESGQEGHALLRHLYNLRESDLQVPSNPAELGSESGDSSSDESDDDSEVFEAEMLNSSKGAYGKLLDAIAGYDDTLPESAECNQVLVDIARTFTQDDIDTPPTKRMDAAIVVAARLQKWGAVMTLMYSGANVATTDRDGRTLLHIVLNGGSNAHVDLAAMLNNLGLSLDDVSARGVTVLEDLQDQHLVSTLIGTLQPGGPDTAALVKRLQEAGCHPDDDELSDDIEQMILEHDLETTAAIRIQKSFRGFNARRSAKAATHYESAERPMSNLTEEALTNADQKLSTISPETPAVLAETPKTQVEERLQSSTWGTRLAPSRQRAPVTVVEPPPLTEFQQRLEDMKMRKLTAAVLRIQAFARGWKARRAVRALRNSRPAQDNYKTTAVSKQVTEPNRKQNEQSEPLEEPAPKGPSPGVVNRRRSSIGASARVKVAGTNSGEDPLIGTYVRALTNFTGSMDGQLSFSKNDIFFILEKLTRGWYTVEKVDKTDLSVHFGRGVVARSRITPYRPSTVPFVARKAPPGSDLLAHNKLIAYGHVLHEKVLDAEFHRAIRGRANSKLENNEQLAFQKNDLFSVVKKGHKHGWWQVEALDDDLSVTACGWVPRRYLEEVELTEDQLTQYKTHKGISTSL